MIYLMMILVTFIISLILIPFAKKLAFKFDVLDRPSEDRKIHSKTTPYLGGLAIYISFIIGLLLFSDISGTSDTIYIIIGSLIILIAGILDDKYDIKSWHKVLWQLFASFIFIFGTDQIITQFDLIFIDITIPKSLGFIFSMAWMFLFINAINLIDGLDGLASGIVAIVLFVLGFISIIMGDIYVGILSLVLLGAVLGFLVYNFYPASIFMGDAGSMFLGYMIAVLSLIGYKSIAVTTLMIPIFLILLPILDIFLAFLRRLKIGESPFKPDSRHFHHRLLRRFNGNQRKVVVLMYLITIFFSVFGVMLSFINSIQIFMILIILFLIILIIN